MLPHKRTFHPAQGKAAQYRIQSTPFDHGIQLLASAPPTWAVVLGSPSDRTDDTFPSSHEGLDEEVLALFRGPKLEVTARVWTLR